MTIVAAIHDPDAGCSYIGSDTQMLYSNLRWHNGRKWIRRDRFAIGYSGDGRTGQVIARLVDAFWAIEDPFDIALAIRDALRADGFDRAFDGKDDPPINYGQEFVYADAANVALIDTTFAVTMMPPGRLVAIGSGMSIALGAAYVLPGLSRETVLRMSIGAAMELERGCGGALCVERIDGPA